MTRSARPQQTRCHQNVRRSLLGLAAAATFAVGLLPAAQASALELSLDPTGVTVSGLPEEGGAVVWGLSRVGVGPIVRVERTEAILTDSGDGTAILPLPDGLPARSVWLAVDLADGEAAVAYAAGYPASTLALAGSESLSSEGFDQPGGFLEWLWVRPGSGETAGAWSGAIGDGGRSDGDGAADDSLRVTPAAFNPVGTSGPPPAALAGGDVLVAVEPGALSVGVITIPSGAVAGSAARGPAVMDSGKSVR